MASLGFEAPIPFGKSAIYRSPVTVTNSPRQAAAETLAVSFHMFASTADPCFSGPAYRSPGAPTVVLPVQQPALAGTIKPGFTGPEISAPRLCQKSPHVFI